MYNKLSSLFPINTERLLIRPLLPEDAASILFIRSNDIVNKYINRPKSVTLEDARNFLARIEKLTSKSECFYRAIILKKTNDLIGTTCYFNFNAKKGAAEIGYELHPDHHGKGIMQEAIAEMIAVGFKEFKLETIVALVFPDNIKSIQLLIRNNFLPDTTYKHMTKKEAGELSLYYLSKSNYKP